MVKLGDAVRNNKRVVVRHAGDAGPQDDLLGQSQGLSDEQIRGGYILPGRGEMLAYPGLFLSQLVERNYLFNILVQGPTEV